MRRGRMAGLKSPSELRVVDFAPRNRACLSWPPKPMFAYAFDKTSPFYRKLRRARAYKAIERRRVLGAPLRIGERWYERGEPCTR